MDFDLLQRFKPHKPLQVIERDLSQDETVRRKTDFDEEDLYIDFSNARLLNAEIEIPVFKDRYVRPLFLKGKLLRYEMKNLGGGFYYFRFIKGKFEPKQKDRRFPDEEVDKKNGGETEFWIYFDHNDKRYKLIQTEGEFLKAFKEFEETVHHPDILGIFSDFELFISSFWTSAYKQRHRFLSESVKNPKTIQNYVDALTDLKNALPMLNNYHKLLNTFGEIDDPTYQFNVDEFTKQEKQIVEMLQLIDSKLDVTYTIDDLRGELYSQFQPIEKYMSNLETRFYTRGYFIDPEKREAFPNFLEIHYQRQLAEGEFENIDTLKEQKQKCLERGINSRVHFVANNPS